jgi:hypothetical protein
VEYLPEQVLGAEGDDAADAVAEADGHPQRERRAHRLTGQREIGSSSSTTLTTAARNAGSS